MKELQDKNYLAEKPLGKLLFSLSMPAFAGMIVMATYNLVDTIFIGHSVGPLGIAGLTIVFPIQMINTAFAMSLGIGGASLISRRLGEQNIAEANQASGNVLGISSFIGLILSLFGILFIETILQLFGATDEIMPFAKDYFSIVLYSSPLISFAMAGNSVIRAEGNAKMAMLTMLASAGTNLVLDPIFIFGFQMGIKGAAWATVVSQYTAAGFVLWYFKSRHTSLTVTLKTMRLKLDIIREVLAIGGSSLFRQASGSVVAVILNHLLAEYGGDIAIAAYGLILRIMMFTFMPMFGVIQGVQPIIGYNYGAKNFIRVKAAVKIAMKVNTYIAFSGFFILMVFSHWIYHLFTVEAELLSLSSAATRIVMIALPLVGIQMVAGSFFQSIGKAVPSLIIATSRQVLYFTPLVLILPSFFGLNGIWYTFPTADLLSLITTLILFFQQWKKLNLLAAAS